jgi:predicted transcriptional regulator
LVRQFGQLEAVVMDRLWSSGRPVPVREVLEDLQRDRTIAYTTVMTVMDNLHRKGFLNREMAGRAYRYQPTQTREQHHAAVMGEVLAGSSDRAATLLHFLEQMPPEEVARLREALTAEPPSGKAAHS